MRSDILQDALGEICDEYITDANKKISYKKGAKIYTRRYLIAALIAVLTFSMAYAIHLYNLQDLAVVDHTTENSENAEKKVYVSEKALSLNGYEESASYNALQEWLAYEESYITEHPDCRFENGFQRPEEYGIYHCFSQEMVDKLDEICDKYELHIVGKSNFTLLNNEPDLGTSGLPEIMADDAIVRYSSCDLFSDGSFVFDGELDAGGDFDTTVQFQMHSIKKDAFYNNMVGLNGIEGFSQWNYETFGGVQALLAQDPDTGLIFVETEDRFVSVIVTEAPAADMVFRGLPEDQAFLEQICEKFNFTGFIQ